MFALTEVVKEKLFALKEGGGFDAFHQCFEDWQDVGYVFNFFKNRPEALAYYGVDLHAAVQLILNESEQFFDDILNIVEGNRDAQSLDNIIFQPLHEGDDFDLPMIETKAYGKEHGISFLRLYAIRLSDGAYIVVGGLIKTTKALQDCEEGKSMLKKLKEIAHTLRKNQLFDAFDVGVLIV